MSEKRYLSITAGELAERLMSIDQVRTVFEATHSKIILDEDVVSSQVKFSCNNRTWLRYKLRDRSSDGPGWKPSRLTDWNYGGLDDKFNLGKAVEESIYCLDPRQSLLDLYRTDQADFITNPFEALPFPEPTETNLREWLGKWEDIFLLDNPPFPGYFMLKNIPGARTNIHRVIAELLKEKGYEYLTAVPTWWHTCQILEHLGFSYLYLSDKKSLEELNFLLQLKSKLPKSKCSWIVMLQFWAELAEKTGHIPENLIKDKSLILRNASGKLVLFPLSPQRNLWQILKINKD